MSDRAAAAPPVGPNSEFQASKQVRQVVLFSAGAPGQLVSILPRTQSPSTNTQVAEATNLRHINVGDWVKEQDLHSGYDAEFDSYIIDEDKVIRACLLPTSSGPDAAACGDADVPACSLLSAV